jgi:hypothetical protein
MKIKCKACGHSDYELFVINEMFGFTDARCKTCHTALSFIKTWSKKSGESFNLKSTKDLKTSPVFLPKVIF